MKRKPRHPGAIIKRQYLSSKITVPTLAAKSGIPLLTLSAVIDERSPITPSIAEALALVLSTSPELWLNLQRKFDDWDAIA